MLHAKTIREFFWGISATALPEFALTAGVFSLLLLGLLEFGLASYVRNCVTQDAREGARYAIVHGSTSGRIANADSVANYVRSRTALDSIRVITTWVPDKDPWSTVYVTVQHDTPRRGPFLRARVDSSTSKMVVLF